MSEDLIDEKDIGQKEKTDLNNNITNTYFF